MFDTKKPLKILIDADMFVFRCCAACETVIDWDCGCSTLHCEHAEVEQILDDMLTEIVEKVLNHYKYTGHYEILMCITDEEKNFRKKVMPAYKANRIGRRKPLGYAKVMEWVKDNFTVVLKDALEADDCIGILATLNPKNHIIISGDKDMRSIPGVFYDFLRDSFYETTVEEADYYHLYQTLIGDTADNYKGCPGIGPVAAKRILDKSPTWEAVLEQFVKKKLTEEDALMNARVARILRKEEYDFKKKTPKLWKPN